MIANLWTPWTFNLMSPPHTTLVGIWSRENILVRSALVNGNQLRFNKVCWVINLDPMVYVEIDPRSNSLSNHDLTIGILHNLIVVNETSYRMCTKWWSRSMTLLLWFSFFFIGFHMYQFQKPYFSPLLFNNRSPKKKKNKSYPKQRGENQLF